MWSWPPGKGRPAVSRARWAREEGGGARGGGRAGAGLVCCCSRNKYAGTGRLGVDQHFRRFIRTREVVKWASKVGRRPRRGRAAGLPSAECAERGEAGPAVWGRRAARTRAGGGRQSCAAAGPPSRGLRAALLLPSAPKSTWADCSQRGCYSPECKANRIIRRKA